MEELGASEATDEASGPVNGYGAKPSRVEPIPFEDARNLVKSAEHRDAKLHRFIATMRHLYRTGRLDTSLTIADLDRELYERADYRSELEALNLACSYINVIVATTAARDPQLTAEPAFVTPEAQQSADAIASLVRTFLEEDDSLLKARRAGLDAAISGDGFGHVQWELEVEEMTDEEFDEALAAAEAEYMTLAMQAGDDPTPPEDLGDRIERQRIIRNRPTLRYLSPIDVLLPRHIAEVDETPWYAIRSIERLSDVKRNPLYDPEAVKQLSPEHTEADDPARRIDTLNVTTPEQDELTTVYTFYDVQAHRMLVFAKGGAKPLYDGENPNDFNELCLVHLRGYRDGEHLRGFGDLELVAGLLDQVNFVLRQQLDNLERQGTVFVARDDVLTDEDRANLEMARPGDVVIARGLPDGMKLGDAIEAFPSTALSNDVYTARQQLQDDIGRVLGLSDFQLGGLGPARMSGTAAAVADGVATLRAQQRLESYERFYNKVAVLFYKLCQQHLNEDQVVRVIGPDGSMYQETLQAESLSESFFIKVKTGSMAAVNPATRAQRGQELLNLADRMEQVGYDADALRRFALREMGIDPDLMGVRKTPPPAEMAMMQGQGAPSMDAMGVAPDSTQAEMLDAGGPPLPGVDGELAL